MSTTTQQGYGSSWQRLSLELRAKQPWCSFCRAGGGEAYLDDSGVVRFVSLSVDHIDGDTANCSPQNLRVLCRSCHGGLTNGAGWR